VQVSLPTLIAAINIEGLGEPHAVLAGAERFISRRVRHQAEAMVWDELNRGELARGNRLTDDVRDMLTTIQRAGVEYFGWVTGPEISRAVLAAAVGRDAALLARNGDTVHIERVRPEDLIGAFLAQLPEVPPARAAAISVRAQDIGKAPERRGYMVRNRPGVDPHLRRLNAVMKEPRLGGGKLYTAHRDHTGARWRSKSWITVVDVLSGRWAIYTTGEGEQRCVNAVPGTRQFLASRLAAL
jgi:hypothetical protein